MRFVFDTESTGLEPGSRPVEIHSILLDDGDQPVREFSQLINPGMPIPHDAMSIHGITDADVANQPAADVVLRQWLDWLAEAQATCGIGHYVTYDVGVISWDLGRVGLPMPQIDTLCTCEMARVIKATKKNTLDALVDHYGITRHGSAHRAPSDADACMQYLRIAEPLTSVRPIPWRADHWHTLAFPAHLHQLPALVAAGGEFEFAYVDARGVRTQRKIIPYGWAETDKGVSFHGLCTMRGERRTFLADRVEA